MFITLSAFSCEYENAERDFIESKGKFKYSEDILPIIMQHCSISGCHVNGAMTGDFTDYDQLKIRIDNKKFQKMVFELRVMPPAVYTPLTDREILMLQRWIDGGALK